jgi:DNA mismatch endonuclease (patch repair protein)
MTVRSLLHRGGFRYRVNARPLPAFRRRADLVFYGRRVAVFVDGCFWHGCPDHRRTPKRNGEWWTSKIERNARRDRDTDRRLLESGWFVIRVWEHEDPAEAAGRVADAVKRRHHERSILSASRRAGPRRRASAG